MKKIHTYTSALLALLLLPSHPAFGDDKAKDDYPPEQITWGSPTNGIQAGVDFPARIDGSWSGSFCVVSMMSLFLKNE